MATNVGYFIKESAQSFKRNWVMSLGAIITIYMSLLLVGVSVGSGYVLSQIISSMEQKVSINVWLSDEAAAEDVDALQSELLANDLVATVELTTKEEALENFKKTLADNPDITDQLESNPLPASLDIELKDPRNVETLVAAIQASPTFLKVADDPEDPASSINYGKDVVSKLFAFTRILRIVSWVFIGLLGMMSLIFINNAIRVAIYARRKEIGIMRLVGASNWFIRAPFLFEGVIQSMVAAIVAIASLSVIWLYLPKIEESVPFLPLALSGGEAFQVAMILVAAALVIGLTGSGLALRRYLNV
jgi:cell division transport system permease protein